MGVVTVSRRCFNTAAAVLLLAGTGSVPAWAADPIRIGWVGALSGAFALNGLAVDYGIRTSVKEINAKGGINGRQLELITRDSTGDPAKAVTAVKELLYNNNIDVVIGPINSGEGLPTVDIVAGAKKPQFVLGVVDEMIDPSKRPFTFRGSNTNTQWIRNSVNFGLNDLKADKVAILNDNSGYGSLALDLLKKTLSERGVKPVYTALIAPNKVDVTDEINKAREAGANVVQVWSNATGLLARIINARGEQNWNVPIVGHPTILGEEVKRLVRKPEYLKDIYSPSYANAVLGEDGELPPMTRDFLNKHQPEVNQYLGAGIYSVLQGVSVIQVYAAGVAKAKSVDPEAVQKALEEIGEIVTPFARFHYTATDHNGFADDGLQLVAVSSARGLGYMPVKKR